MKDNRTYRVLIQYGDRSIWACEISHADLIEGIQNGGLRYFGDKRQKIMDFVLTVSPTIDQITCHGRFENNE